MDNYYSDLSISDDADNESIFNDHVIRESDELRHIDVLLNRAFSEESE